MVDAVWSLRHRADAGADEIQRMRVKDGITANSRAWGRPRARTLKCGCRRAVCRGAACHVEAEGVADHKSATTPYEAIVDSGDFQT